eukprot:NODE_505_length_7533_cov_0.471886.p9 type:complete len:100 gc:universal NODE_505_length_7533_cov_0.471886:1154-1453(+)
MPSKVVVTGIWHLTESLVSISAPFLECKIPCPAYITGFCALLSISAILDSLRSLKCPTSKDLRPGNFGVIKDTGLLRTEAVISFGKSTRTGPFRPLIAI